MGVELLDSTEDWLEGTEQHACHYKPKLRCTKCETNVTSTTVSHVVLRGQCGCLCHYKTEAVFWKEINDNSAAYIYQSKVITQKAGHFQPKFFVF